MLLGLDKQLLKNIYSLDDILTQLHHQNLDWCVSHWDVPLNGRYQFAEEEWASQGKGGCRCRGVNLDCVCYKQPLFALEFMVSITYTA